MAIEAIAWSPDSEKIATGHTNGLVKIWSAEGNTPPLILQGHTGPITSINWKSDGTEIITGSFDTTARVWNTTTGDTLAILGDSLSGIGWAGWTVDNSQIMTFVLDSNQNLRLWDADNYNFISKQSGSAVVSLAWKPNDTQVAVGTVTGNVQLWDELSFQFQDGLSPVSETYGVYALAWHPNEDIIGFGDTNGNVRLWDISSNQVELSLRGTDSEIADWYVSVIRVVFFSPDGSKITSLSTDGVLRTWDISTGNPIASTQITDIPVYAASLSPDGTKIAYGGEDGSFAIVPAPNITTCNPTQTVAASDVTALINAINGANANSDASVIGVEGTYTLTAVNNGLNALPKITTDIKICSQNGATLTRQAGSPPFRFFEVASNGTLTLENLTLTGADSGSEPGGAILNTGNLTVNNVTFTGNHAGTWR